MKKVFAGLALLFLLVHSAFAAADESKISNNEKPGLWEQQHISEAIGKLGKSEASSEVIETLAEVLIGAKPLSSLGDLLGRLKGGHEAEVVADLIGKINGQSIMVMTPPEILKDLVTTRLFPVDPLTSGFSSVLFCAKEPLGAEVEIPVHVGWDPKLEWAPNDVVDGDDDPADIERKWDDLCERWAQFFPKGAMFEGNRGDVLPKKESFPAAPDVFKTPEVIEGAPDLGKPVTLVFPIEKGIRNLPGYIPEPPVADRILDIMNKSIVSPQDAARTAAFATAVLVIWQTIKAVGTAALNTAGCFLLMPRDFDMRFMGGPGSCSIDEEDKNVIYCLKDGKDYVIESSRNGVLISEDGKGYVLECFEMPEKDMMACKLSLVDA